MKNSTRICILSVFAAICICMPIPYETMHYRIHQRELREQTVSSVLAIDRCGGTTSNSESFIPNDGVQGASDRGPDRGKCINPLWS